MHNYIGHTTTVKEKKGKQYSILSHFYDGGCYYPWKLTPELYQELFGSPCSPKPVVYTHLVNVLEIKYHDNISTDIRVQLVLTKIIHKYNKIFIRYKVNFLDISQAIKPARLMIIADPANAVNVIYPDDYYDNEEDKRQENKLVKSIYSIYTAKNKHDYITANLAQIDVENDFSTNGYDKARRISDKIWRDFRRFINEYKGPIKDISFTKKINKHNENTYYYQSVSYYLKCNEEIVYNYTVYYVDLSHPKNRVCQSNKKIFHLVTS